MDYHQQQGRYCLSRAVRTNANDPGDHPDVLHADYSLNTKFDCHLPDNMRVGLDNRFFLRHVNIPNYAYFS